MPDPKEVLKTFEEDQSNAGRVLAAAPPRPALTPEARQALLDEAKQPPFPQSATMHPLFSTRGVTIEKRDDGPVTLGELRQFVIAAEGLDDGLPLVIQGYTEPNGVDSYYKVDVRDEVNLNA